MKYYGVTRNRIGFVDNNIGDLDPSAFEQPPGTLVEVYFTGESFPIIIRLAKDPRYWRRCSDASWVRQLAPLEILALAVDDRVDI